jgi:TolA-binding protein
MKFWKIMRLAAGLSVLIAAAPSVQAEEKKAEQTTAQYLEQLQIKLDHTAQRVNQPSSEGSSVVGLRGSKQESASKQLYWKGKKGKTPVTPDEVKAFRAAIDLARAGKTAEATAGLKTFQKTYPNSAMNPDVEEAISKLSAVPQP